jgi:diacylglycerol kinase (ATP)
LDPPDPGDFSAIYGADSFGIEDNPARISPDLLRVASYCFLGEWIMRYVFSISSRAGAIRQRFVGQLLDSHFSGQRRLLLLDPSEGLIDLLCRSYGSEGLRLIAVGGDGTIHRLLTAAVRYHIPIGILPCGTANDLARAIGLKRGIEECCCIIPADHTRAIDLIAVNGKLFATCGGLGLPSSVAIQRNRHRSQKKESSAFTRAFCKATYFLAALRELRRSHSVHVRIHESRLQWSGCVTAVVLSNQSRFGALFSVSPGAVNDDGVFDLCVIPDPGSRFQVLAIVLQAVLGRRTIWPGVVGSRLRNTRILTEKVVPFLGDGEILFYG